jgi:lipopolysaccharide transport system permease protein
VFLLLAVTAALGAGLWFAALNVTYRDFRIVLPFCIQLGLYISPVGFSSRIIPEHWRLLYSLNPMVGVIDGFRYSILGDREPLYLPAVAVSTLVAAALLAGGTWYFRATERSFADVI